MTERLSAETLKACVVGGGAWGSALACVLARGGHDVRLWAFEPEVVHDVRTRHENRTYLPGVRLPESIGATSDLADAVGGRDLIVSVCPAQHTRRLTAQWAAYARPDATIVSASKGIEVGSEELLSQVFDAALPEALRSRVAFLSGPSFAREVAEEKPTVVVIAARDEAIAEHVQHVFARPTFRTYRTTDVVGVEVAGALKNVMAIATGICDGLGLGQNARAALITRGLVELTRMAVQLGANPITLMGLAGMGDLVLTCTADMSRNRTVGLMLGAGRTLGDILGGMPQIAEGVPTAESAFHLARRLGVDTPILDEVYHILHRGRPVAGAVDRLMTRALKREEV